MTTDTDKSKAHDSQCEYKSWDGPSCHCDCELRSLSAELTQLRQAKEREEAEPMAYLVMNEQDHIVCAYRKLNLAERLVAKGHLTHNEKIVPVYERPHIKTEAEKYMKNRLFEADNFNLDVVPVSREQIRALLTERGIK